MRQYKRYFPLVASLVLAIGFASCGKKNKGPSYDFEVTANGSCPNLAALDGHLKGMSDSGWIRRQTVTMKAADQNATSKVAPRANYLSMLAFSNFEYTEQSVPEYRSEAAAIGQSGCDQVSIGGVSYAVRETTPNSIVIAHVVLDPNDKETDPAKKKTIEDARITYNFLSSRAVDIVSHQLAIDPCFGDRFIYVDKTVRMTWGPAGDPTFEQPQEIDPAYLQRATRALSMVPNSISAAAESNSPTVMVPAADLRALKASPARTDLKVCPYRPGPPTVDDPEMPSSETPVPTPTPEPTPEPVPTT